MVAVPWEKGLPQVSQSQIDNAESISKKIYENQIVTLRKKYPSNKIVYCPYGLGTYELIRRLNEGKLPGAKYVAHPDRREGMRNRHLSILKDQLGHPSELAAILHGLIWLQTIYDCDLSEINQEFRATDLPHVNINEIAAKISKQLAPYHAVYSENAQ